MKWRLACGLIGLAALANAPAALAGNDTATAKPQFAMVGPGLHTVDVERALRFYRDGLGLTLLSRYEPGTGVVELIFSFDGSRNPPLFMVVKRKDSSIVPPGQSAMDLDKVVLSVGDVELVHARLKALGYSVQDVKSFASGTKLFFVTDPDGHRLEILQRLPDGGIPIG